MPKANKLGIQRSERTHTKRINKNTQNIVKKNNKKSMINASSAVCSVLAVIIAYMSYDYYIKTRVNSPLSSPLVEVPSDSSKFWGSYRSGAYFGLKTKHPTSPVVGLMWFPQKLEGNNINIRHWCNQGDRLKKYGWIQHDGEHFGNQIIEENDFIIKTTFVKRAGGDFGGDWTARINVEPKKAIPYPISLLFYMAIDNDGYVLPSIENHHLKAILGNSSQLGNFRLSFSLPKDPKSAKFNYLFANAPPGFSHLKEVVNQNLALFGPEKQRLIGLIGKSIKDGQQGNFLVHQVTFNAPYTMEVVFESESFKSRPNKLAGPQFDKLFTLYQTRFEEKFEKTFGLEKKGFSKEKIDIAKAIFSNALGGVGYFYGESLVQSEHNKEPVEYWSAPLLTAVPSRSFFPRGFLWDEGFHNLLLNRWDMDLTKSILAHWLNLINTEGWIPREQILGLEARERVPKEFIIQQNTNANPPTFFLTLETILQQLKVQENKKDKMFLKMIFPRLKAWFKWFNTSQVGKLPGSYRWRGRDEKSQRELNPKSLTSGLDDYPRASHPTDDERHVDIRCWMAHASSVLSYIAQEINETWEEYEHLSSTLKDNKMLEDLHWSTLSGSFSDYGSHSNRVRLVRPKPPPAQPGYPSPQMEMVRQVLEEPEMRFVDQFGYVSLFPFLLKIINPDNPKLAKVLQDLKNPDLLWTNYGLRSLSPKSPIYMKYNTENDPPYWRGAIWINMNYLAVRALYHYSEIPGPYQEEAFQLYKLLRQNIINNILNEYQRSGYIWENYNDKTGFGQGSHPFTGWSSLVVLLMAELY